MNIADKILDHVTDVAAIATIGAIVLYGGVEPSGTTLASITTIALGKRYMKQRGG